MSARMLRAGALWLPFLFLVSACTPQPEVWRFEGATMGTSYHVTVVGAPATASQEILQGDIDRVLARVDELMSTWRSDSEVSRLNRAPVGEWFELAPETHAVLVAALDMHRASGGRFDITVGPMLAAWGFGPRAQSPRVPPEAEIAALLPQVGSQALELADAPPRVRKTAPREIELSAIAPGYAVDLVVAAFAARGVRSYMVEIGGEVRTGGSNPQGGRWRIGIEQPDAAPGTPALAIVLSGESVSTSGDYRDFFEVDGRRYSHTFDPLTGRPVEHGLASVTVLAETCMRADALATALHVLGPQAGLAFAERENIAAYFIVRSGEGFEAGYSAAFRPYLGNVDAQEKP